MIIGQIDERLKTMKRMSLFLLEQMALPLMRRAGTAIGTVLVSYGVQGDTVTQITTGLAAASMVTIDLLNSYLERRGR